MADRLAVFLMATGVVMFGLASMVGFIEDREMRLNDIGAPAILMASGIILRGLIWMWEEEAPRG